MKVLSTEMVAEFTDIRSVLKKCCIYSMLWCFDAYRSISVFYKNEPKFVLSVSRESLALVDWLVLLDTRDLVVCLVSVEPLVLLELRERR